jgi:hypothetical protein
MYHGARLEPLDGVMTTTHEAAPPDLFEAVRAARMSALPTPRRVLADAWQAFVGLVVSALIWLTALDLGGPLLIACALLATGATVYYAARGVRRARAIRRNSPASELLDDVVETRTVNLGAKAFDAASVVFTRDFELSTEFVGDIAADVLAAAVRPGKARRVERLREKLSTDERAVVCVGALGPDVPFGALRARTAEIALTDGRLRVYRHRRKRLGELLVDAPLSDVRVREWHPSISPLQPRHRMLRLTAGGKKLRLAIPVYWRDEAQLMFDVLYARQLAG